MRQPFPAVVHNAGTLPQHDPRHRPARHSLLLCRVGDGIQVIGRAAALAEPRHRLHKLVVREVGECARQSRRVGGESAKLPI